MKTLITGANGMVARAVIDYCRSIGDDVTALTRQEMDIADRVSVDRIFADIKPDIVINCAAFTDVDGAEANEELAYRANSTGTENLASACRVSNAVFITISTDYVFDGTNPGFYLPTDKPNPQSVYARSKFEGEIKAAAANPNSIIVRSGWIYGSGGTNFLSVMHRLLSEGKRIKVIGDSYGTPTNAGDLAQRLRELAGTDAVGIYHVTNAGDGTSYLGFAEKVCEIGGFDLDLLESVRNDDLKRPAARPRSSKLGGSDHTALDLAPMPNWEDALRRFIQGENGQ